jgi:hypothetical protein
MEQAQIGDCSRFWRYLHEKYALYKVAFASRALLTCRSMEAQLDALCREMRDDVCLYDVRYWPEAA